MLAVEPRGRRQPGTRVARQLKIWTVGFHPRPYREAVGQWDRGGGRRFTKVADFYDSSTDSVLNVAELVYLAAEYVIE
jgi:hypothetical protein